MSNNMYCGAGPVPKGKVRGTPEYCVQTNQIRYYGIVAIDPKLLKTAKGTTNNLVKEQLKLKKIEDEAKILISDVKKLKIILDSKASNSEIKKAQKKMDELLAKRDKLIDRLKKQKKIVEQIEKSEKENEKILEKYHKSTNSDKKKKKSGSKTSKKK